MLKNVLAGMGIEPERFARFLGFDPALMDEWAHGKRALPDSILPLLTSTIGIPEEALVPSCKSRSNADLVPAVWYRFRGENLGSADLESVLLIRQLGFYISELESVTGRKASGWDELFSAIRSKTDQQAPPRVQGRNAAGVFTASRNLAHTKTGIGEVIRGNLRSMGLLVVESPITDSKIEGCSFYVGPSHEPRPCIFANTHHNTWFRRNYVILHEVAHAIFDARNDGASLDLAAEAGKIEKLAEERADAFAQEALVPESILRHIAQREGVKWSELSAWQLAGLVASTHVEQRVVLAAARDAGLIDADETVRYLALDIAGELVERSDHALTTERYIAKVGDGSAEWRGKRATTIPPRTLRLPVPYVKSVVDSACDFEISISKAAKFLMIDEDHFRERFGSMLEGQVG